MGQGRPHGRLILAAALAVLGGCGGARWSGNVAASFLPQLGVEAGVARELDDGRAVEAAFAYQFLDDTDLADDGNAGADDVRLLRIGGKRTRNPGARRSLTFRYGAAWLHANGRDPLLLDRSGDYVGGYAGVGFETDLGRGWRAGPELRALALYGENSFELVPQVLWRFSFDF